MIKGNVEMINRLIVPGRCGGAVWRERLKSHLYGSLYELIRGDACTVS